MSTTMIYYLLVAAAGLITGLFAGYNGLRKNQTDAASSLVNDALSLVNSLKAELERMQSENEKLLNSIQALRVELAHVQAENANLRDVVKTIEAKIAGLEQINENLQKQINLASEIKPTH